MRVRRGHGGRWRRLPLLVLLLRVLGLVRWEEGTGEKMEVLLPFGGSDVMSGTRTLFFKNYIYGNCM